MFVSGSPSNGECILEECSSLANDSEDHCVTNKGDADDIPRLGKAGNLTLTADENPKADNLKACDHLDAGDNLRLGEDDNLRLGEDDNLRLGEDDNLILRADENPKPDDSLKADDNLREHTTIPAVSTVEAEPVAAATEDVGQQRTASFGSTETRRQNPLQLPKLRNLQTTRSVQSFTSSMSSLMARRGRNKPLLSIKKPLDNRSVQQDTKLPQAGMRNTLTSREKTVAAAVKRRKCQRGVAGGKRYSNNGVSGKAKRDSYPVKLPACQQPYLSDPTQAAVLPPDTSSLRWDYALDDPDSETERLRDYKANRRRRYMVAAKMAFSTSKLAERTASRTESIKASRTMAIPCAGDGPGLLPRIPGVERIFPARMTNPKLLVGCS